MQHYLLQQVLIQGHHPSHTLRSRRSSWSSSTGPRWRNRPRCSRATGASNGFSFARPARVMVIVTQRRSPSSARMRSTRPASARRSTSRVTSGRRLTNRSAMPPLVRPPAQPPHRPSGQIRPCVLCHAAARILQFACASVPAILLHVDPPASLAHVQRKHSLPPCLSF